jgi:MFS family permease
MIAGVAGALVTGVVAAATGNAWPVFIVDAATFLVSVVLVAGVTRGAGRPDATAVERIRSRGMGGAVADGLRLIARSRPLVAALGGVSVTMLGVGAINVLFVPFLVRELGGSPAWAGPMEGAQTLSMILASAVVPGLAARRGASTVMTAGLAGIGACIVLFGLAPAPWAMLLLSFAVGWFVMPVQAITMTIVQQATTDETRGRVAGALNASMQTASIASMAVAGVMADVVGMRAVFFAGGAVAMAAAAVAWVLFRTGNETDRAAAKPARPVGADGS